MAADLIYDIMPLGFPWQTLDPFLFCVHHEDFYPNGNEQFGPEASLSGRNIGQDFTIKDGWRMYHGEKVPGFPVHPHRGFETVTVVRRGYVDHADSMGAAGRYGGGDVQWMTAGKGVQHAEMFPLLNKNKENTLELFQIWLNLPSKNKMVEPHFKMLWSDSLPKITVKDLKGKTTILEITAGMYNGAKLPTPPPDSWAADNANNVWIWTLNMEKTAQFEIPKSQPGLNRMLYFFKGSKIKIGEKEVSPGHGIHLRSDTNITIENGAEAAQFLLLQGKPISEPVVQYGPFVMNTQAEIQQTFMDYRQSNFGGWPWNRPDPIHADKEGRFAKHADGTMETRPL